MFREYYHRVSTLWKDGGTIAYLKQVDAALQLESARARQYLHPDSELKLLAVRVCALLMLK